MSDARRTETDTTSDMSRKSDAVIKKGEADRLGSTKRRIEMRQSKSIDRIEAVVEKVTDNVLDFGSTLRELRKNVDPNLVRQREGWCDRNGNVQMVEYVDWQTVADILDENAPNWAHTVKDIRQVGDIMTVTAAISIDGVTREGIGTGVAHSEMGIKKAEHDALKRAAVKFGIARDLYKREFDAMEREGNVQASGYYEFPADPVAANLLDLVTAKQLGMIRAVSRETGVDADEECGSLIKCKTGELSKKAASAFIQHLQNMQKQCDAVAVPLRKVS